MGKKYPSNYGVGDESHPRHIYALIDPRDNVVRYVGMSKDAYVRLRQHLYKYRDGKRLMRWLEELDRLGLSPVLEILGTITGSDAYFVAQLNLCCQVSHSHRHGGAGGRAAVPATRTLRVLVLYCDRSAPADACSGSCATGWESMTGSLQGEEWSKAKTSKRPGRRSRGKPYSFSEVAGTGQQSVPKMVPIVV